MQNLMYMLILLVILGAILSFSTKLDISSPFYMEDISALAILLVYTALFITYQMYCIFACVNDDIPSLSNKMQLIEGSKSV